MAEPRCIFARPTPTGAWKRCKFEPGHVGGHVLAPIQPKPKRGPTERQQDTMNEAREAEKSGLETYLEDLLEASETNQDIEHALLQNLGLRHGPQDVYRYETEPVAPPPPFEGVT